MGANTALLDSYDLGKALIDGIKANEELEWILKRYEDVMVPRGLQKVLESRATGESGASKEIAGGRLS
jgi:2-polyprenyl-6-methoxyphenol hydroxylase-like FAD-dependent oxidoreductase